MPKINKQDLRQISYQEFGEILEVLTKKVKQYIALHNIKFDLVVPILRSGAFTGMHLASQLGIDKILPIQYKYYYSPKEEIIKKFNQPELLYSVPDDAHILIVDTNTVYGAIAQKSISDIKAQFPKAKLFFASAQLDQSVKDFTNIEHIFYGILSNAKRELSFEDAIKQGIPNEIKIFPWEDLEEEWKGFEIWS